LGEPVKQRTQALWDFQGLGFEDLGKPLADLIANRAAMGVVKG